MSIKIFEECADAYLHDWRKKNKNELCNLYIENEQDDKLKNAYLSAIICKYEPTIQRHYLKANYYSSFEDCLDRMILAIIDALKRRRWLDEDSSIYNDPAGPDKAINRTLKTMSMNDEAHCNRQKTMVNNNVLSVESLQEEYGDYFSGSSSDIDEQFNFIIKNYVQDKFEKKEYFICFLLYIIQYDNVFDDGKLNEKRVIKYIHAMDDTFCNSFSQIYDIDINKVRKAILYFINISTNVLKRKILWALYEIKQDLKIEGNYANRSIK